MFMLLTQLLNLIVGSHENSQSFWEDHVVVGIIQRFGGVALDNSADELMRFRKMPDFLKSLLETYCHMIGLRIKEKALKHFTSDRSPYEVSRSLAS